MKFNIHLPILIISLTLILNYNCIRWNMYPNNQKCLREEITRNILVNGVYEVAPVEGQQIDYVIKDSKNHILSQKEDISSGKFKFSVEKYEIFEICFISKVPYNINTKVIQEIFLDIKTEVETQNYEKFAEVIKLKPLELDLKRLEDLSQAIVLEFNDMKTRADEMHSTNESTNKRVFYFGTFSMICLVMLATWQVFYLRRYFKAKKLIE